MNSPSPNPYESPESPTAVDSARTDLPYSGPARSFFVVFIVQVVAALLLQPGDGGQWIVYAIITLMAFDLVAYFTVREAQLNSQSRRRDLTLASAFVILFLSLGCVITLSYALAFLRSSCCS